MDHILSELSTMTHPSWVALHGMAHGFILYLGTGINNVAIVSGEKGRDSVICTYVSISLQTPLPSRLPHNTDHYIYYCGQESLRRNGVAIKKECKMQYLDAISTTTE